MRRFKSKMDSGALATECAIALAILSLVMLPVAFSFVHETKLCRIYYHKAVALEIIDGEMEALVAGEWRAFALGEQNYTVRAASAANLPRGRFQLTIQKELLKLEWTTQSKNEGGRVSREVLFK